MTLGNEAIEILIICALINSWHVTDSNLVHVADLVKRGFVTLSSDYDHISINITDTGQKYLLRARFIKPDADSLFRPFSRTETGEAFAQYNK